MYEGYFSKIHWRIRQDELEFPPDELTFNENFRGYWSITSR